MPGAAGSGDIRRSSLARSRRSSSRGTGNSRGEESKRERKEDNDGEEKDVEKRADKLRSLIRQGRTVGDEIIDLINDIDEDEEKLSTAGAVLNAKDLEHGKNLLLYAAAYGQIELFACLKKSLAEKRNKSLLPVVVKGLRASDDDGAPLLFHAAKSGSISCLQDVKEFISNTVDQDELVEQLLAQDNISSTIIMYAAKSGKLKALEYIKRLLDDALLNEEEFKDYNYLAYDDKGRSLLHIAARSGDVEILKRVIGFYEDKEDEGAKLQDDFRHPDKKGRTPLMQLLRNKSNAGLGTLLEMYEALDKAGGGNGAALNQLTHTWKISAGQEAPTGLMHAAHGGMSSLELVFNALSQKETSGSKQRLHLDEGLMGSRTSDKELFIKRLGILLAEAASGGSVKVLRCVVSAIKTNTLETGTDSKTKDERGEELKKAMEAIESYGNKDHPAQNVFKYAISSGDPGAVKFIKDCVNKIFHTDDGHKVWKLLSGTDEGINCLTYAASVEGHRSISHCESESNLENQKESRPGDGEVKTPEKESRPGDGEVKTPARESRPGDGEVKTPEKESRPGDGEVKTPEKESRPGDGEVKTSEEDSRVEEERVKDNRLVVFDEVLTAVDEAAQKLGEKERVKRLESLFVATTEEEDIGRKSHGYGDHDGDANRLMPLAGAVFRSNEAMVKHVYRAYQELSEKSINFKAEGLDGWNVRKIMNQIPDNWTNPREEDRVLYDMASSGGVPNVAPSMLGTIVEVLGWAHDDFRKSLESQKKVSTRTLQDKLLREKRSMRAWMERLIQVAAERGAFHAIRALTDRDFFPFPLVMPPLLERIGDNEENTIEIVVGAISGARNPFHLGAVALRFIRLAHVEYPMHEHSLNRLQGRIDCLMIEILSKLPKTLRSIGLEFGAHKSSLLSKPFPKEEWERLQEADKLGFAVVQWILEPSTVQNMVKVKDDRRMNQAEDTTTFQEQEPHRIDDPLQSALDRGSDALSFTNSPLVRDYMHSKFSKSLPSWASRAPYHHNIHEKFFKYSAEETFSDCEKKEMSASRAKDITTPGTAPEAKIAAQAWYLRWAWRSTDASDAREVETAPVVEGTKHSGGMTATDGTAKADNTMNIEGSVQANHTAHATGDVQSLDTAQDKDVTQPKDIMKTEDSNQVEGTILATNTMCCGLGITYRRHSFSDALLRFFQGFDDDIERGRGVRYPVSGIPHRTPMPALQFVLAGIVGKPATFYEVPIVRFAFGIVSHTAMLGLFCSCIFLENEDKIEPNEAFFYIFIFGLVWRELMEIGDLLPPREPTSIGTTRPRIKFECGGVPCTLLGLQKRRALPPNRVASALKRYLFYDSWNILDASTIVCALIALIFRLAARFPDELTSALSSLHLSYPSNIRETTFFVAQFFLVVSAPLLFARLLFLSQVDQTLGPMSQIIWTMLSHLARFSLFVMVIMFSFAIAFYVYFFDCYEGDDDVQEAYGTLERSMLSLFKAMLGDFEFDVLLDVENTCERPSWANTASACLLVLYLIIMAILLLNLLIAVLSTAHAEVERNAKEEFHLARSKAIQQNWKIVLEDRLPAPMNLVKPILGTIVDFVYDLLWVPKRIWFSCNAWKSAAEDKQPEEYRPFSKRYQWKTGTLGFLHRLIFACSMGLVALAASVLLWVISIPWMAWRYFRWCFQRRSGNAWYHEGYFSSLVNIILKLSGWLGFVVIATIVCAFSILGLILLWLRGLKQVIEWRENHWTNAKADEKKHGRPPERDWENAWDIARSLNNDSTFDVGRLLRVTTGSNMEEVSKICKKAATSRGQDHEKSHYADIARSLDKLTRSGGCTGRG